MNGEDGTGVLSSPPVPPPPPSLSIDRIDTDLLCLWPCEGPFRGADGGGKLCEPTNGVLSDEEVRCDVFFCGLRELEERRLEKRFWGDLREKKEESELVFAVLGLACFLC